MTRLTVVIFAASAVSAALAQTANFDSLTPEAGKVGVWTKTTA
jgi:hypothetical protein